MKKPKKPTVKELSIRIRTTLSCAELKRRWEKYDETEKNFLDVVDPYHTDPDAKVVRKLKVTDMGER